MIYLLTGANGSGKTLLTLKEVREKSLKESRPVYYNGRFELTADFGWQKIDFKDWQTVPDGAIFLMDECHNDLPVRSGKEPAPEWVKMLAEHRRRGFDFYLITQHPLNIDAFVRRLIGAPGWHRHLKRQSGAPLVSVLEWASVNEVCQKAGSGDSGSVAMVTYPKEVYTWYQSTSLDTAKIKIPFQVKVLIACLLLVPVLAYYGYTSFFSAVPGGKKVMSSTSSPVGQPSAPSPEKKILTSAEYVASFVPRLENLPYTAPRYDEITKPSTAPFPAACLSMGKRCSCYSQQGTLLKVAHEVCDQIVKNGFFMDWVPPAGTAPALAPAPPVARSDKLQGGSLDHVPPMQPTQLAGLALPVTEPLSPPLFPRSHQR